MNKTLSILIVLSSLVLVGLPSAAQQPIDDDLSTRVEAALVTNVSTDRQALDAIARLGDVAVPMLEPYLDHDNAAVRERAFRTLVQIPSARPTAIVRVLSDADYHVATRAFLAARHALEHPKVMAAFIDTLLAQPRWSDRMFHARRMFEGLADRQTRQRLAAELVPRLIAAAYDEPLSTQEFDSRVAQELAVLLATVAPTDHSGARSAVAHLRGRLHANGYRDLIPGLLSSDDREMPTDRLAAALQFAGIRLSDAAAFSSFAHDLRTGDRDTRYRRLKWLASLPPSPNLLGLVQTLADDRQPIIDVASSHDSTERMKRTCDFVVEALAAWYPDEMANDLLSTAPYDDEALARASQLLQRKNAANPTR